MFSGVVPYTYTLTYVIQPNSSEDTPSPHGKRAHSMTAGRSPSYAYVCADSKRSVQVGEFASAYAVLRQIDQVFTAEDFEHVELGMSSPVANGGASWLPTMPASIFQIRPSSGVWCGLHRRDQCLGSKLDRRVCRRGEGDDPKSSARRWPIEDAGELSTTLVAFKRTALGFSSLGEPRVSNSTWSESRSTSTRSTRRRGFSKRACRVRLQVHPRRLQRQVRQEREPA